MTYFIYIGALLIFLSSLLHFYWALGGSKMLNTALPTEPDGSLVFRPSKTGTFAVGMALLFVSVSCVFGSAAVYFRLADYFFAFVFFIRVIGDFRYAGFFRKIRSTKFARLDRLVYTPLMLLFSLVCLFSAIR